MTLKTLLRPLSVSLALGAALAPAAHAEQVEHDRHARHVIVISVDGLHQSDLDAYVTGHPQSTLARLVGEGASYAQARTPFPSDSFPGLTAIVTGAHPRTAGIYYDDTWNRALLPAGTTSCAGVAPGVEVTYFEQLDRDLNSIDAGEGVGDLSSPAAIRQNVYRMSKQARDGIDATQLPVDPVTCRPVYPHEYLRVNTIFEVARAHGLHTAWSDKHLAYDLVNGPSGAGVDDLFAPEINSLVPGGGGDDWTKDNFNTQFYDALKVQAVLNWAHGLDHDGTPNAAGAPAIYGMNFQTVSTAQKLNVSHYAGDGGAKGLGGYGAGGTVAGPVLAGALDFVDGQLGRIVAAVDPRDTVVVVSAKHGQSPLDRGQLRLIDDGEVIGALNDAWAKAHPAASGPLVLFGMDDDGMLLWLADRSAAAAAFAKSFLWGYAPLKVGGSDAAGHFVDLSGTVQHAGLRRVFAGSEAAELIGVPPADERVPDVIGIAQVGVVYSNPTKIKKIAEHGGDARPDRHVPIVVWGAGVHHVRIEAPVETAQIAPSVLEALGLPTRELEGVRREHTAPLPGLR
ncbi:MAG: alkaline phosphatase family protein [Proteobacteria bacterium]|nr:alkaline phosphatase family protein [Pseudomonadota bacterium]